MWSRLGTTEFVNAANVLSSVRTSIEAACGITGDLFRGPGRLFRADLAIDADAAVPAGTVLLRAGRTVPALVRFGPPAGDDVARTVSIKVPDAYGPGADQDFLLASSLDGIPWHHAVVPRSAQAGLYSSLWLYLAGVKPVVFGARVAESDADVAPGDRVEFLIASAVSRFTGVGQLLLGDETDDAALRFAASNCGGGLQALPPARLYAG